jgi:hypothetical protein
MADHATLPFEPDEIWLPVVGYEGLYEVSSLGRVWSNYRGGRYLKPGRHVGGYPQVNLAKDGVHRMWLVHQLVALAFHGSRPDGEEVRHRDGIAAHVPASNLEWGTHAENIEDRRRHGTLTLKEVCDNDHEYTEENTYWYTIKTGRKAGQRRRYCKLCMQDRAANYYERTYRRREPTTETCPVCGSSFTALTSRALYCSGTCGTRAYRQRKAAAPG